MCWPSGNDFAVLKLARNVRFTDRKLPACLPDPTIPLKSPSTCYIAGWGVSEQGVGEFLLLLTICRVNFCKQHSVLLLQVPTCVNLMAVWENDFCFKQQQCSIYNNKKWFLIFLIFIYFILVYQQWRNCNTEQLYEKMGFINSTNQNIISLYISLTY